MSNDVITFQYLATYTKCKITQNTFYELLHQNNLRKPTNKLHALKPFSFQQIY